jgi:hypothetical protein
MNRDPELIQKQILDLLQDLLPEMSLTEAKAIHQAFDQDERANSGSEQPGGTPSSLLPSETMSRTVGLNHRPSHLGHLFELGDVPAVQDRFHALLKKRLQSEIQKNPPLFPWESEIHDYATEPVYRMVESPMEAPEPVGAASSGALVQFWARHLASLQLPVPLPEAVVQQLLERCQRLTQSTLREGARLVQAVEDLFPDQSQSLNYLAGLVMTAPARSGSAVSPVLSGGKFPTSFEDAALPQQMVLSLLAAREILNSLSLSVSERSPRVEKQWMTDAGPVSLSLIYEAQATSKSLKVLGNLPSGGSLSLCGVQVQSMSQRADLGSLVVEVIEPQLARPYTLEIGLLGYEQTPLSFTVLVEESPT